MSTEAALLRAITANRSDDTARLVYADWLDENGAPDRAAYLRLQVELVREWWYDKPCTELYARIAELTSRLDPTWLATARRCTTPAPPVNVEDALPDLRGKAKTAVRLHPRPGEAPVDASKIGGMFLWPKKEPWPVCPTCEVPYVTALQLREEDAPELGFPPGTDLFQLLWCPKSHNDDRSYCPRPAIYWRKRSDTTHARKKQPRWKEHWDLYDEEEDALPRPCVVYPERVTEYQFGAPDENGLPTLAFEAALALANQLQLVEARVPVSLDIGNLCYSWLSEAAGDKVGGFPVWNHNERFPRCACGRDMEYLLLLASSEYDGSSWGRWVPIEDRPILNRPEWRDRSEIAEPHGCSFGRSARMQVFVCRAHPESGEWPVRASID